MSPAPPPVVILDRPQLAENIGAAARAMANFGLEELRLVAPRDGWPQDRAYAAASGAEAPLNGARVFPSVAAALEGLQHVLAATARPRELQLETLTPREAAARAAAARLEGLRCGLLFGPERAGLESADVALCQGVVTIPVDPGFRSLNLAQSVAVLAYEHRLAAAPASDARFKPRAPPAPLEELSGLYAQLEAELDAAGFFYPPENRPATIRNLRVALGRAGFTSQEVRTLRGVVAALSKGRGRTLEKLAAARRDP